MTDIAIGAHLAVITELLTAPDVTAFIHTVVTRSVLASRGSAAAVVTFDGADGEPRRAVGVVGSYTTGERPLDDEVFLRPGRASATQNAVVIIDDTAASSQRWQSCADVAIAHDVHGVRAFPIRIDGDAIGSLVVCTDDRWTALSQSGETRDATVLQIFADLSGAAIMLSATTDGPSQRSRILSELAATSALHHQAIGVLAERTGLRIHDATDRLYAEARRQKVTVDTFARRVVRGEDVDGDPSKLPTD